jgi:NADPH-dependent 2,4-dienoyl-CoA reductase/sulfur reductase-like enzyme
MGAAVAELHARNGTPLICGTGVTDLLGTGHVSGVRLVDGRTLPADLVVVAIGAAPATDWLAGSGLPLDDGIVCDATLNAGLPGIYAAGDVARWPNGLFGGRRQRLEHWTSAAEQGATAARNALNPADATPYATVPYFWSDWYDSRIQFVGIPDAGEVEVVDGEPGSSHRWVVLYRGGDRLVGALAVNGQSVIMKYRALISRSASWDDAMASAAARRQAAGGRRGLLPGRCHDPSC